jgi:hypothetical protein
VSDLRDLYQEVVLDHSKAPRNFHAIENASGDAQGFNPLCGDQVHVWVALDGDTVKDVSFTGNGCAISKASASMMTQAVKGRSSGRRSCCSRSSTDSSRAVPGPRRARQARRVRGRVGIPGARQVRLAGLHTLKAA